MHTLNFDKWIVHHNGDFSGDIILQEKGADPQFVVPFEILEAVVAEKLRTERITALGLAAPSELLGAS